MEKLRILVIDDHESIRYVVKETLKAMFRENVELFEAAEGGEGIKLIFDVKGKIDLVITDYRMPPGDNGFEVAMFIKESYPEIKVIMLTGESISKEGEELSEFEKKAINMGIKKIIQKPPDWEEFKKIINGVLKNV